MRLLANAGVLMLVRIGVDQATAAPAPILFSILRREIPLKSERSGLMTFPPARAAFLAATLPG